MKKLFGGMSDRTVRIILICLAYLLLVIFAVAPTAYSKFTSSSSGNDSAIVAKFDVDIGAYDGETPIAGFALSDIAPGYEKQYKFVINNNSDVTVKTTFNVSTLGELPLEFTAKQGTDPAAAANGYNVTIAGGANATIIMTVSWPAANNDPMYAGLLDLVELSLVTEQID